MIFRSPIWLWGLPFLLIVVGMVAWRGIWPRLVLVLRAAIALLLLLALADPIHPGDSEERPLLVLADQSASLGDATRTAWAAARQIAEERGDMHTILAAIGSDVAISVDGDPPVVGTDRTDLAAALQFAANLYGDGGRAVLVSDGAATQAGIDQALGQLQQRGIAIDVLPIPSKVVEDARIVEIGLPAGLRAGQQFQGEIRIASTFEDTTPATLIVSLDGATLAEQAISIAPGQSIVPIPGRTPDTGLHRLRAELQIDDRHSENNSIETTMLVGSAPRVLVIERQPDTAAHLRNALEAQGIQSEALRPANLSSNLSNLRRFDAIILQDVPATALSLDQQAALREYVRTLGHGVLALGGANSYSLGGYKDTPLEEVLPVSMDTPPDRERQQIAMLLIIDRSASMYASPRQNSPLELAKGGAVAATEVLTSDDRVGVVTFDTNATWQVPFQRLGEGLALSEIQDRIRTIDYGGGTDIYRALGTGIIELTNQDAPVRHALLLTDGRSNRDDAAYRRLIDSARAHNITLTTIAIGSDADTELLELLAEWGGGRYHFVSDPTELPQLTLEETEIARENPRIESVFQPQPDGAHAITRGLVPSALPDLGGYLGVTTKPEAEDVLVSSDGDPILAAWQYGLGRAVAWTSDTGEQWGAGWRDWDQSGLFWSQTLGYLFPDPSQGPFTARIDAGSDQPMIIAEAHTDDGAPLELADIGARVQAPDGTESTVRLQQIAPGRYTAPLPAQGVGAYTIDLALRKGEQRSETSIGWTQSYGEEWTQQPNQDLLERIASSTGGRVIGDVRDLIDNSEEGIARPTQVWWPWLVGAAAILWPVELAVRRRIGPWSYRQ